MCGRQGWAGSHSPGLTLRERGGRIRLFVLNFRLVFFPPSCPPSFPFHHLLLTPPSWINQGQITWGHTSFVSTGEPPSLLHVIVSNKVGKYRRLKQLSAPQHLHQTKLKKPSIPSHECTIKTMWQKWKLFHHNISQFFLTKAKPPSWIHISQHLMHYASAYSRGPGNCQSLVKDLWKCLFCKQTEPRPSTWALIGNLRLTPAAQVGTDSFGSCEWQKRLQDSIDRIGDVSAFGLLIYNFRTPKIGVHRVSDKSCWNQS